MVAVREVPRARSLVQALSYPDTFFLEDSELQFLVLPSTHRGTQDKKKKRGENPAFAQATHQRGRHCWWR